jgi:hypothetical protein
MFVTSLTFADSQVITAQNIEDTYLGNYWRNTIYVWIKNKY